MAKKIFLVITTLFIGFTILFYSHQFGNLNASLTNSKNKTTDSTVTETSKEANSQKATESKAKLPGNPDEWELILVNESNEIKEEPTNLKELPNGYKVDSRIYDSYMALAAASAEAGFELTVISAYRSVQEQTDLVARDIESYQNQGYSESESKELAMKYLTVPGLSEHHTGLALDVLSIDWYSQGNTLDEAFGETDAGKWLAENAAHYGFIIRYEKGKEAVTGINYEPWHIRYVGIENAEYMYDNQLVLEEYIDQLKK